MAYACSRCQTDIRPRDGRCAHCSAAVIVGATHGELTRAAKLGAGAVLAVWCYLVDFSPAAIVAGLLATALAGSLARFASRLSRSHRVRTV